MFFGFIPFFVIVLIVVGIGVFFSNRNRNTDPSQPAIKASVGDFLLNTASFIGLYVVVGALLGLIFTVIEKAYPKMTEYNYYYYSNSSSISWPVSILIILFPIFLAVVYFLEKSYTENPEKRHVGSHKWFT